MKLNTTRKTKRNSKQGASTDSNSKHWLRYGWKLIYQYRLWLDDYKCVKCGFKGSSKNPLQVHHIRYSGLNTHYEIINCRTLCKQCHEKIHANVKSKFQ